MLCYPIEERESNTAPFTKIFYDAGGDVRPLIGLVRFSFYVVIPDLTIATYIDGTLCVRLAKEFWGITAI